MNRNDNIFVIGKCFFGVILFVFCAKVHALEGSDACGLNISILLHRKIQNAGFHRNIITEFHLSSRIDAENLKFLVIEHLPAGIYVDPYELANRQEFGGPQVLIMDNVDLELPDYKASPINVMVYLELNEKNIFKTSVLPIHLRYQFPHDCSIHGYHVPVTLSTPSVYYTIQSSEANNCESIDAACSTKNNLNCRWIPAQISNRPSDLQFNVPVGCLEHMSIVAVGTFIAVSLSVVVLLYKLLFNHNTKKNM